MLRRVKPKAQLALVVDQLEDLFAAGFTARAPASIHRCPHCFDSLPEDVCHCDVAERFLCYLIRKFPELVELVGPSGRFDLLPPTRAELRNMIRLPAAAAGLRFERDIKSGRALERLWLTQRWPVSEPLPLLEHLLSQLYRKQLARRDGLLAWSDYGNWVNLRVHSPVTRRPSSAELNSDAQQAFDFVMRQLVSFGSGKALCRPVPYQDLVSSREFDNR